MGRMPFAAFAHNEAWLEISLLAQALLRWAGRLCLEGELALAEPKRLRQRLLHVAGRLVRSGRRTTLRLPRSWPWAEALPPPSRGCGRCRSRRAPSSRLAPSLNASSPRLPIPPARKGRRHSDPPECRP